VCSASSLQYLTFFVSVLAFGGLIWYACETFKIRKATQDQLEASRRPCLVLCGMHGNTRDAIMRPGSPLLAVAPSSNGWVQVMNIGTGPAFNARYLLTPLDESVREPSGHHLVHVLNHEANPLPVPIQTVSNGKWLVTLSYESISKRRYESKTTIDSGVLMTVEHRQIT
jgi:hypothetical protein